MIRFYTVEYYDPTQQKANPLRASAPRPKH